MCHMILHMWVFNPQAPGLTTICVCIYTCTCTHMHVSQGLSTCICHVLYVQTDLNVHICATHTYYTHVLHFLGLRIECQHLWAVCFLSIVGTLGLIWHLAYTTPKIVVMTLCIISGRREGRASGGLLTAANSVPCVMILLTCYTHTYIIMSTNHNAALDKQA